MWDEMYETMLYEDEDMESAPPPTAAQLDAFEQKFDFRLPQSYREFITRFGPGSIEIWYEFPSPECQESTWDLTRMNEAENEPAYVLFARLWSNGSFCWAREQVTNEDGPEYAIYYLERLGDAIRLCDSFEQFFEEFCLFNGHERIMPEIEIDAARLFSPLTLRAKQKVLRERAPSSGRDPLEEIRELAPPPEEPRCATGDWEALETELGLQLPNEYRAYYSLYGAGSFNGYLIVHPAFDELGFMSWVEENIDEIAEYQHATYPSPGGLLPCAQTLDGDGIYWLTEGEPDSWTIVYQEGLNTFYEIDTGLVQFIADVLSRRSELIPDVLPGCRFSNPAFEVARPHVE